MSGTIFTIKAEIVQGVRSLPNTGLILVTPSIADGPSSISKVILCIVPGVRPQQLSRVGVTQSPFPPKKDPKIFTSLYYIFPKNSNVLDSIYHPF